jgi:N-acyl homoserine lactone hydrolase
MKYEVYALKCASTQSPTPELLYLTDWGKWTPLATYIWVIKGGPKPIVVDTGLREGYEKEFNPYCPGEEYTVGPGEDTVSCLKKVGVAPQDVGQLIATHLHYDHFVNVRIFKNAEIYVSKKGWLELMAPRYPQLVGRVLFPRDVLAYLADEAWDRLHLVEEEEIAPGVKIFWVGGHTMCSQAISVQTRRGTVVIGGDTIFLYRNIEQNIPAGLCYSLTDCYDAMARMRKEGDIILPNHDPEILKRYPKGRIA